MARSPGTKATKAAAPAAAATKKTAQASKPAAKPASAPADAPASVDELRAHALAAFLQLLAERPFERISLGDVAAGAGVSLSELRAAYGSTFDILAAFVRDTDRKVLAASFDDMTEEPARDRLFDVLMRRLDVLAPHKAALRSLAESARRNPFFALALNRLAVRSQQWMLAAAKIDAAGLKGAVRAQGLALVFGRTVQTFLHDEDPGLAPTMATLDRELARGERALGLIEGAVSFAMAGRRRRAKAQDADAPESGAPEAA